MNKFIFVCYEHGTGGESLSVEISRLPFCETLLHEKHGGRAWTFDCFNKLFLKNYNKDWMQIASQVKPAQKVRVVPSHYTPETLRKLFPNELFVIINSPATQSGMTKLLKRIYKQVWLTKHNRLDQKIGYFIQNCGRNPNREQIKKMNKPISNGGIQCLINDEKINPSSIKKMFRLWAKNFRPSFFYKDTDKLFTLNFDEKNTNEVIEDLKTKLTNVINAGIKHENINSK